MNSVVRLREVAEVRDGQHLARKDYDSTGTVEVHGAGGLMGKHSAANVEGPLSVVGRIGTIGVVRFRAQGCWVNNNAMAVVATSKLLDPFYLHLLLEQFDWDSVTAGTAQPFVRKTDLREAELVLPPVEEQRRIAEVLGTLDDAIETTRSLVAVLDTGMQFEAAVAIQSSGEKSQPLTDVATIVNGYSYKSSELINESATAMVNLKNFGRHGGFRLNGLKPFDGSPKPAQMLASGDALVAKTDLTQGAEVIGRCLRMPALPEFEQYVASLDIAIVRSRGELPQLVLCALLAQPEFRDHCLGFVNGTTVLHMPKAALETYALPVLDADQIASLSARVDALASQQDRAFVNLHHLSETRNFLLPRLIAGELRVEAASDLVEAVT